MDTLKAPYDSRTVGNSFLDIALQDGAALTPMKLLKLVYIAHGWYLGIMGKPLISDNVEAWKFGPVIPKLYHEIKRFGARPISDYYTVVNFDELQEEIPVVDKETAKFLELIWRRYGQFDGQELSAMTHQENTPWAKYFKSSMRHIVIPNDAIKEYYAALWGKGES